MSQTSTSNICVDNVVNLSQLKRIWTPDFYIYNSLNGHQLSYTKFNSFMRFYPNGTIYFWSKHLLTISCAMDFTNYPMDRQNCSLEIGSSTFDDRFEKYFSRLRIKVRIVNKGINLF